MPRKRYEEAVNAYERAIVHGLIDVNVYKGEIAFEEMRGLNQWNGLTDRARTVGNVP